MKKRRDVRRLAMQVLYQIDVGAQSESTVLADSLDQEFDPPDVRAEALELALAAWQRRAVADQFLSELAQDWPTHRQPPVDRAILRLAYYEITSGHAPVKVAINEAVELAKQYSSEQSPAFINGVLDKIVSKVHTDVTQ